MITLKGHNRDSKKACVLALAMSRLCVGSRNVEALCWLSQCRGFVLALAMSRLCVGSRNVEAWSQKVIQFLVHAQVQGGRSPACYGILNMTVEPMQGHFSQGWLPLSNLVDWRNWNTIHAAYLSLKRVPVMKG